MAEPAAATRRAHRAPRTPDASPATSLAYARLRGLVVAGRLAPGAPLVELDLSARLGVSRTPVRAAVQRLQQEGFAAAAAAGRMIRAVVAPLTADDMLEVLAMVGALEGVAGRLAAGLDRPGRLRLAREMAAANSGIRGAARARRPDVTRAQELHAAFHRALAAAAGPRLAAELDVLQAHAERYERVYATAVLCAVNEALTEHDAVVDAVRRGDSTGAEDAIVRHWEGSAGRCRDVVTILGERGNW